MEIILFQTDRKLKISADLVPIHRPNPSSNVDSREIIAENFMNPR